MLVILGLVFVDDSKMFNEIVFADDSKMFNEIVFSNDSKMLIVIVFSDVIEYLLRMGFWNLNFWEGMKFFLVKMLMIRYLWMID